MKKQLRLLIFLFLLLEIPANAQVGFTCDEPIEITSLPYQHIDNTNNYGNTIVGPQGSSCGATPSAINYISGNDVLYKYTATHNGFINISMTPNATRSSVFIYAECVDIGVNCLAGVANGNGNPRIINQFPVVAEEDYYILLSSNSIIPSYGYSLIIQYESCPKPTSPTFDQFFATLDGGTFSWSENGTASSWEIAVQEVGDLIPQGNGNYVDTDGVPEIVIDDLQPAHPYQFWVRSVCSEGGYSAWAGPVVFNTLICEPQNRCNFTFRMTDSANNGWNGARMQVRQNDIVQLSNLGTTTIGASYNSGAGPVDVTYSLCNDIPFDVFWITAGAQPQQCVLSIVNSFGQTIYTKPAGVSSSGEVVYSGILNCTSPVCNVPPTDLNITSVTDVGATINWTAAGTENMAYEIFLLPSGAPAPTSSSIATFTGVNGASGPFFHTITNGLASYTAYDVYVRIVCNLTSELSPVVTFATLETCPRPVNLSVNQQSITTTSATLLWSEAAASIEWDVLLLAVGSQGQAPQSPTANPIINQEDKYFEGLTVPSLFVENLEASTTYYFYVRSICEDKSVWSGPFIFNTRICNEADKCPYRFILKNALTNSWNGARMQVRQNGVVVATLGAENINNAQGVAVALCNNIPFDIYWSQAGEAPNLTALQIVNPYQEVVYTKQPSLGTPLTILYSDSTLGNCIVPTCTMPTNLQASFVTTTTAQLLWTENNTASQWEIYLAPEGAPLPVNDTPLNTGIPNYFLTAIGSSTFTVADLQPATKYNFYVRSICSSTDMSAWTILQSITFLTKVINDECDNAITIPVNPGVQENTSILALTYGATASLQPISCGGSSNADIWFKFIASSATHIIKSTNIVGGSNEIGHTLYTGNDCQNMTQLYCINNKLTSVATNLTIGQTYFVRFFTYGSNSNQNITFKIQITSSAITAATNDEPANATPLIVNTDNKCSFYTDATINGATATDLPMVCVGSPDDDVWFSFVAISTIQIISIFDVVGTTIAINHAIYSGTADNLVQKYCSLAGVPNGQYYFDVGETYYIRVWSAESTPQTGLFSICVKSLSTCTSPNIFCNASETNPLIIQNTVQIPSIGPVACLNQAPNPTYLAFQVAQSGKLVFDIMQNTGFDSNGNPTGIGTDIDFVAWGPFTSLGNCEAISFSECPECPNNTESNTNFYPYQNIIDCSYDASTNEFLTIPNAVSGEYYIILITNFSQNYGYIKLTQTNLNFTGAGSIGCSNKLQLTAFIDENANGLKDINETNFTYGSFSYQKNEEVPVNVSSPLGIFSVFDSNPSNLYDFGYQIDGEYSSYYAAMPTNYSNISVSSESATQYYFPITKIQDYNDVSVSLIPNTDPRPGFQYSNKIVYKNTGTTVASGTLTFTKDNDVIIVSVGQEGIVNTANGFSYNYTNLMPYETRSIDINISVPSIPLVNISDVLTSTLISTIPMADINILNNSTTISQTVIGAYDPNDKVEAHGEKLDFTTFNQDDYLFYTIRFQNTGTANAINIRIEDVLDAKLDEESIRMVSASHNYVMERVGSKLVWKFDYIYLPSMLANEELSNGYLTFMIKVKPGFALGDIIPNFAEIYFDTNPAIITNTFTSTFEEQLATPEFSAGNINIYPNPSNGLVYISVQNTNESLAAIKMYDVLGKTVLSSKSLSSKQSAIDVSAFAKGVYMIEITTENNLRQIKKLVVN